MKNICKKITGIMLITILIASTNIALAVTQSEIDAQKNQKSQITNQITEAEEKQKEIEEKKSEAQKQVENISSQIDSYESQIDDLDSQIANANAKIKEAEEKIEENQKEYDKKQETLKKRLVAIYESGETSYLDVLLSSSSLMDFISNYYLVSELTEMDTQLMDNLEKEKEEIENSKKEIEESKETLTTAKASKESITTELKNAKSEKDKYVAQLSEEEKKIQQEIDEIKSYEKTVSYKIAQMEKEYQEYQKNNSSNNTNSGNNSGGNYSGGTSSYGFGYPVANHATSNEFGIKKSYYHSSIGHTGLDFTVREGTPVYAIGDGVITLNYDNPKGWGTNLLIRHEVNGTKIYSFYAHLSSACVTSGWVNKGTLIGYSGNTGSFSQGAHLHFEIRSPGPSWDSNCRNPRNYLP